MSDVPAALRRAVIERAGNRCEYCRLAQTGQEAAFHVDHVKPRAADGATAFESLALACVSCSLRKSARQSAPDPVSGAQSPLFNPRTDSWAEHFRWEREVVVTGLAPTRRATVDALSMNRPLILAIRREEAAAGRHPG